MLFKKISAPSPDNVRIALDVMSGESEPEELIHGGIKALEKEGGFQIALVGDETRIQKALQKYPVDSERVRVVHASETIGMDELPAKACRIKKDSSVMVASQLVAKKEADAFFSPGNTGASFMASLLNIKKIEGVIRPALMTLLPTLPTYTRQTLLIDVGANVDCKAKHLCQFGIMGDIFSRCILGKNNPRVGLLNVGEEPQKGNELVQKAYRMFQELKFNFVGNIEGDDIYNGELDVVVCDGFIGNVVLKLSEGLGSLVLKTIKKAMIQNFRYRLGAYMAKGALMDVKDSFNSESYGGAILLGIDGCAIIGHGRGGENAVMNAIFVAIKMIKSKINIRIKQDIDKYL